MTEMFRQRAALAALAASLLLHALGFVTLRGVLSLPKLDLELALPNQAEFGVVEQPAADVAPAASAPPSAPPVEPAPPAAAAPKLAAKPPAQSTPAPVVPALAEAGAVGQLAPRGTQLALRMDLDRIRSSPLAPDVSGLLEALPDVRALLDGSGISAARDLSRLFLASPDLRREHVVMAGRYVGDEATARAAVERLATQRGLTASWRVQNGITIAPWHNADTTARVLALLGPQLFAITREADLARVLRVAHAVSARTRRGPGSDPSALVAMAPRELLNLAVENARSFVRGARVSQTPERAELSVREGDAPGLLALTVEAPFPDAQQAEAALQYWSDTLRRYASHPVLALLGLDALLRDTRLVRREQQLQLEVRVPEREARLLLRFARDALHGPGADGARNDKSPAP